MKKRSSEQVKLAAWRSLNRRGILQLLQILIEKIKTCFASFCDNSVSRRRILFKKKALVQLSREGSIDVVLDEDLTIHRKPKLNLPNPEIIFLLAAIKTSLETPQKLTIKSAVTIGVFN